MKKEMEMHWRELRKTWRNIGERDNERERERQRERERERERMAVSDSSSRYWRDAEVTHARSLLFYLAVYM